MMSNKQKLFIGSANEWLDIARTLEFELESIEKTEKWDKVSTRLFHTG